MPSYLCVFGIFALLSTTVHGKRIGQDSTVLGADKVNINVDGTFEVVSMPILDAIINAGKDQKQPSLPTACLEVLPLDPEETLNPAESVCKSLKKDGWQCSPRVLAPNGRDKQSEMEVGTKGRLAKDPNHDKELCPYYISCHCEETAPAATSSKWTKKACNSKCEKLGPQLEVQHEGYLDRFKTGVCPAYIEACENLCNNNLLSDPCKKTCTEDACVEDFTKYEVEKFSSYEASVNNTCACMGRLEGNQGYWARENGGRMVINRILQYQSKAKCCGKNLGKDIKSGKEIWNYVYLQDQDLKATLRSKFFNGAKACPDGFKFFEKANTKEECANLANEGYTPPVKALPQDAKRAMEEKKNAAKEDIDGKQ